MFKGCSFFAYKRTPLNIVTQQKMNMFNLTFQDEKNQVVWGKEHLRDLY